MSRTNCCNKSNRSSEDCECSICLESLSDDDNGDTVELNCKHYFHNNCIVTHINSQLKKKMPIRCPNCNETITTYGCGSNIHRVSDMARSNAGMFSGPSLARRFDDDDSDDDDPALFGPRNPRENNPNYRFPMGHSDGDDFEEFNEFDDNIEELNPYDSDRSEGGRRTRRNRQRKNKKTKRRHHKSKRTKRRQRKNKSKKYCKYCKRY